MQRSFPVCQLMRGGSPRRRVQGDLPRLPQGGGRASSIIQAKRETGKYLRGTSVKIGILETGSGLFLCNLLSPGAAREADLRNNKRCMCRFNTTKFRFRTSFAAVFRL